MRPRPGPAAKTETIIAVTYDDQGESAIPLPMCSYTRYRLPDGYDPLYWRLTGQPAIQPPSASSANAPNAT